MLLLAGSNAEAAELSRRVQTRLIQLGTVGRPQAALSDGNHAGVGDLVRARLNTKIDAAGRPLTNAGFRTGCSPPDSDDFEAERRHWAATSWPGGRADTANASLFSCGTVLATDARLGTLSCRLASIWGDSNRGISLAAISYPWVAIVVEGRSIVCTGPRKNARHGTHVR